MLLRGPARAVSNLVGGQNGAAQSHGHDGGKRGAGLPAQQRETARLSITAAPQECQYAHTHFLQPPRHHTPLAFGNITVQRTRLSSTSVHHWHNMLRRVIAVLDESILLHFGPLLNSNSPTSVYFAHVYVIVALHSGQQRRALTSAVTVGLHKGIYKMAATGGLLFQRLASCYCRRVGHGSPLCV